MAHIAVLYPLMGSTAHTTGEWIMAGSCITPHGFLRASRAARLRVGDGIGTCASPSGFAARSAPIALRVVSPLRV